MFHPRSCAGTQDLQMLPLSKPVMSNSFKLVLNVTRHGVHAHACYRPDVGRKLRGASSSAVVVLVPKPVSLLSHVAGPSCVIPKKYLISQPVLGMHQIL